MRIYTVSYSKKPIHKRRRTKRYVFPTTKLVGQAIERNMKDVWSWLLSGEVSCIGIYGMRGVGKTTLAAHIHNQLQDKPDISFHVCWIAMSQEFSIYALQDLIAEAFGLCLPKGKDVMSRAGDLRTALSAIQNHVIILDDLWDDFHPEKVGISRRTNVKI